MDCYFSVSICHHLPLLVATVFRIRLKPFQPSESQCLSFLRTAYSTFHSNDPTPHESVRDKPNPPPGNPRIKSRHISYGTCRRKLINLVDTTQKYEIPYVFKTFMLIYWEDMLNCFI